MNMREAPTTPIDPEQIAQNAASDVHSASSHRKVWLVLAVTVLIILGVIAVQVITYTRQIDLAQQQSTAANAARSLEGQVIALGAKPVTQAPAPVTGVTGPAGPAGRGIASTHLVQDDLYVIYTDGESVDVGRVVGATGGTGATGDTGAAGRGITASTVNSDGDLLLTYTDGAQSDVGHVVGARGATGSAGRGVTGATITSAGVLQLTYTDGSTQDVGPVIGPTGATGAAGEPGPVGPSGVPGANGADGQPPVSWTYTDALGISHTCSRVTGFDPANPRYACS